jgi:hypothetical protein
MCERYLMNYEGERKKRGGWGGYLKNYLEEKERSRGYDSHILERTTFPHRLGTTPFPLSPLPPLPINIMGGGGKKRGERNIHRVCGGSSKEHGESCLKLEGLGEGDPLVLNGRSVGTRSRYRIEKRPGSTICNLIQTMCGLVNACS